MDILSPLLLLALIFSPVAWLIYRAMRPKAGEFKVCTTCGHCGPERVHTPGSIGVEVFLWLLLFVPGLIYSIWRLSARSAVCESCGGKTLVKPGSPVGRRVLAGQGLAESMPAARKTAAEFPATWATPKR
jgi:hypothetical protein